MNKKEQVTEIRLRTDALESEIKCGVKELHRLADQLYSYVESGTFYTPLWYSDIERIVTDMRHRFLLRDTFLNLQHSFTKKD